MAQPTQLTRRGLLKGAAAVAVGAPYVLNSAVLAGPGRAGANDRIHVASIGIRNMGGGHLGALLRNSRVRVVAVCDVDRNIRHAGLKRADDAYAQARRDGTFKGTAGYNDFREVVARDDVDAVVIATPDQWHAAISIAAMKAGKDVYVEKPMTLAVREGRAMADVAARCGRVLQVGSQRRSGGKIRLACEIVRNGRIGKLVRVECGIPVRPASPVPWQPQPVPDELDYEMWLGPAPWQPYTQARCHYNFRFVRDYSGGEMTNFGAHYFDVAQWGIGADGAGPVEVQGEGQYHGEGLYDTFHHVHVVWTYANGVKLICRNGGGTKFIGTDGWIDADSLRSEPKSLATTRIGPGETRLYRSNGGHMANFLDCIRTRKRTAATVEIGHRSATVCHIGNLAMILRRKLKWDPVKEEFPGDDEANRLLWRPYRQPWGL